jgi:hypothetical protein
LLAALLADPWTGLSVADLARRTRFTKPNVVFAIDALVLAGLLEARSIGNERRVLLIVRRELLPGLRADGPLPLPSGTDVPRHSGPG